YTRRVICTSSASVARACRVLSNVMVTSAMPRLRRDDEPLKITSVISPPRRLRALCSPSTQRTASTMLLLPEPLGPTMPVLPAAKSNVVLSAKDLKPVSSSRLSILATRNNGNRGARAPRLAKLRMLARLGRLRYCPEDSAGGVSFLALRLKVGFG